MLMQLDGPGLAPLSGGKAAYLVVLLHGVAANGNDLISLGSAWRNILPEAEFIASNAPFQAIMRRKPGNGSAWLTARRKSCSPGLGKQVQFSIAFSMNCWLAASSATPVWRSPGFRRAPRPPCSWRSRRCRSFPVDGEREGHARSGRRARDGGGEAGPWPCDR